MKGGKWDGSNESGWTDLGPEACEAGVRSAACSGKRIRMVVWFGAAGAVYLSLFLPLC